MRSGWFKESHRHSLAARGISTKRYLAAKTVAIDWKKAPKEAKYDFYGVDSKGRRVRLYGKDHAQRAANSKFSRIERLNKKYATIEGAVKRDIDAKDDATRENARATYIILKTGLRPGSEKDTKADVEAAGLTTLDSKDVKVTGNKAQFNFIGKKGVKINKSVSDKTAVRILKEQKSADKELFPNISDDSVRKYVRKFGPYKTKDFRTLYANKVAKQMVNKGVPKKQVVAKVAEELQNTPSVASGAYIDPKVFK
jgi:DNA topoisomerase-1